MIVHAAGDECHVLVDVNSAGPRVAIAASGRSRVKPALAVARHDAGVGGDARPACHSAETSSA